jgi:hypothetical protein
MNFDGDRTEGRIHAYGEAQLRNFWWASLLVSYHPPTLDDRLTRGGALVGKAQSWGGELSVSTDSRARTAFELEPAYRRWGDGSETWVLAASARWRPAANVELQLGPRYSSVTDQGQYVTQFSDPADAVFFGRRAVFAAMAQRTLSVSARANWTFTPALSLELFAQPFVSTGRYRRFQEYLRPRSGVRVAFDSAQLAVTARDAAGRPLAYRLDPDRDPATPDFGFASPDFSVRSLRGNAVLRWEYRPGSTLFLVWQQERGGSGIPGDFLLPRDLGEVFRQHPDNVFVVKATWWMGR